MMEKNLKKNILIRTLQSVIISVCMLFSVLICACDNNSNNSSDNNNSNDNSYSSSRLTLQNYQDYLLIEYTYTYQQDTFNEYMCNVIYNVTVRSRDPKYTFNNCSITVKRERPLDSRGNANFSYSSLQSNLGGVYPSSPYVSAVEGTVVY